MKTSEHLQVGFIYSRQDLREKFETHDATIRNGVFRPKGHDSIWLFVTEDKSDDMTDYKDELSGDDLFIDGQSAGRTDKLLIEHAQNDQEVILFYRRSKREHDHSGFRFEGRFAYFDHRGTRPAHFHFRRVTN
jgi:putative restriction endonuclease